MFDTVSHALFLAAALSGSPQAPAPFAETGGTAPDGPSVRSVEPLTVELAYRGFRTFEFELPDESYAPIADGIPIAHSGGDAFAARVEGGKLMLDVEGNGTFKAVIEPPPAGETVSVTLRGTDAAGEPLRYTARVRQGQGGWEYSCSGGLVGNLGETKIVLFDQDLDGLYGEPGEDALVVGRGRVATTMSTVILVDDALHTVRLVAGEGAAAHLELTPFEGATGTLDLVSGFETKGKVLSLQVADRRNHVYLDLADHDEGARVPVGTYRFDTGRLASGDNRVSIASGRMEKIVVEADASTTLAWGGPLTGEFTYGRQGLTFQFEPDKVWYYGRAGEEYYDWTPIGASPKFVIVDAEDRAELVSGVFPGT
jgi:hypothetical protein